MYASRHKMLKTDFRTSDPSQQLTRPSLETDLLPRKALKKAEFIIMINADSDQYRSIRLDKAKLFIFKSITQVICLKTLLTSATPKLICQCQAEIHGIITALMMVP